MKVQNTFSARNPFHSIEFVCHLSCKIPFTDIDNNFFKFCIGTRHLTMGIHSAKCVIRQFFRRANIIECTYTNLDSIAYYTLRLYDIAYCS